MEKILNATEVRQRWSEAIDTVVRKKPIIIKRNRDVLTLLSFDHVSGILEKYQFNLDIIKEDDGSLTGSLQEIDLLVNAKTQQEVIQQMLGDLVEYAEDYMNDFEYYFSSRNRKSHFPYVYRILLNSDQPELLEELISVRTINA